MKYLVIVLIFFPVLLFAQADEKAVRNVLALQEIQWNAGNIDGFMQGYWNNDSLLFIGKNGVKYGYTTTLENYRKSYPDTASMGKLRFTLLEVKKLDSKHYFVVGKWHLTRSIGNVQGHFTLLFKNIGKQWKIIADHSS